MNVFDHISNLKVIPVVVLNDVEKAKDVGDALCKAELPCAEITFRTKMADKAIGNLTKAHPQMLIGAGTVLTTEQVDKAVDNGAKFIVAPGFNPTVVEHCLKKDVCIIPGVATPSEVDIAMQFGLNVLKFFPAKLLGGVDMIKALAAPFHGIKFLPTGGISSKNLHEYLACEHVIACAGSWMIKKDLIDTSNFSKIVELTSEAINIAKECK